ncbi:MAG: glycoside hydrolase family 125 protein [Pseudomonadota bacterium]
MQSPTARPGTDRRTIRITEPLRGRNQKPIDLGIGRMSASVMPDGRLCSVNSYHSEHGFITLTRIEQMPEDRWYDSDFVREYRQRLACEPRGIALLPQGPVQEQRVVFLPDPMFVYTLDQVSAYSHFSAASIGGQETLVQQLTIENTGNKPLDVPLCLAGTLSLTRCSYGQLTEGGPIPIPEATHSLSVVDNRLSVENVALNARFDIFVLDDSSALKLPEVQLQQASPIEYQAAWELHLGPGEQRQLTVLYALGEGLKSLCIAESTVEFPMLRIPNSADLFPENESWQQAVIVRNVDYILSCCSIPVSDEHTCVITDHQLLPLSWNRDAYYMIECVRACARHEELVSNQQVQTLVRAHLLWMFELAHRPEGCWGRAYLTTGRSKDQVFQLDQQCYPLLELCEYYEQFGDAETVLRAVPALRETLSMLERHRAPSHWLYETGETPADDDVAYPYHFSSQVLVWHTLKHLDGLNRRFQFVDEDLAAHADRVRTASLDAFTTVHNGRELFAYLTDLGGSYQLYHDANDLPSVFAPLWGFCKKDDPRWLNTMRFAFSPDNEGGYYPGEYGGLGSVHTRHKWPLGDGQELLFAWLIDDTALLQTVLEKLRRSVQWDGMYNEAVDEKTGEVRSRHWFSWPGAFIAYGLIKLKTAENP